MRGIAIPIWEITSGGVKKAEKIKIPIKNSSSKIHEKSVFPRAPTRSFGRPSNPSPAIRMPTKHAAKREKTVFRVTKAKAIAVAAGTNESKPR